MEILELMKQFILEKKGKPFYKSDLRDIGIDPKTAEEFFKIIQYVHRDMPPINITEAGGHLIISQSYERVLLRELQAAQKEYDTSGVPSIPGRSIEVRLRCEICNEIQKLPEHCDKQIILDLDNRIFRCQDCHSAIDFPNHCGKPMLAEYVVDNEVIFVLGSGNIDPTV